MKTRLMIVALCAGFIGSAMAADEGQAPEPAVPAPVPAQPPGLALPEAASAPAATQPQAPAAATPVAPAQPAVPASAPAPTAAPAPAPQAAEEAPKSGVPPEKRQGPDITQCLSDGVKTDKEIAACAEPYSPRHRKHK